MSPVARSTRGPLRWTTASGRRIELRPRRTSRGPFDGSRVIGWWVYIDHFRVGLVQEAGFEPGSEPGPGRPVVYEHLPRLYAPGAADHWPTRRDAAEAMVRHALRLGTNDR